MKRTAEQWAEFLDLGFDLDRQQKFDLALLLRAMVAEREEMEWCVDVPTGELRDLQAARRRAEGEE